MIVIGAKVQIRGREEEGFAEVTRVSADGRHADVRFYVSPAEYAEERVAVCQIVPRALPLQSRCCVDRDGVCRVGRALAHVPGAGSGLLTYWVQFPNGEREYLREDVFHVISYKGNANPLVSLGSLSHETPYFAARRTALVRALAGQTSACQGLTGISSSRIELFPHQVEVARRVLQDPVTRYLLADEVGLGKTIEAGVILRQLSIDHPDLRAAVFVPALLTRQWEQELEERFDLPDVRVLPHEDLRAWESAIRRSRDAAAGDAGAGGAVSGEDGLLDVAVVDEAHRVVADAGAGDGGPSGGRLYEGVERLSRRVPRLLLLSATPILHREEELLKLLHLLDPQSFRPEDLESFRRLLSLRQEIGRSLRALEGVTRPTLARNQVRRLAELLPGDPVVSELSRSVESAAAASDAQAVLSAARRLRVHVGETYRVHRRMLRTRRALLSEQFSLGASRQEETAEHELDDERLRRLWGNLEEWRVAAAAHVARSTPAGHEGVRAAWVEAYFTLAEALSVDLRLLRQRVERRLSGRGGPPLASFEPDALRRLLDDVRDVRPRAGGGGIGDDLEGDRDDDRPALLAEVVRALRGRHGPAAKHVVFCSDAGVCADLARRLGGALGEESVALATAALTPEECERQVARFKDEAGLQVLVADGVLEEGRNLQFARRLILYDLPWAPMRLEQRVGRVDRIDRVDEIPVKVILTVDDADLALDQAWYEVLVKGFGLFSASLSDLQFLVDREVPRLRAVAFEGGPAALALEVPGVKGMVEAERRQLAEQDVIDGLRVDQAESTPAWKGLQGSEREAQGLADALCDYLTDNLRFWVRRAEGGALFSYQLRDNQDPLVPADRVLPLARYADRPFTHRRVKAARPGGPELLRPGHPLMSHVAWLAGWDERGRAYALWRRAPGVAEPELIFHAGVLVGPGLGEVRAALDHLAYDDLSRTALLRLIAGWFPATYHERLVDAAGDPAGGRWERLVRQRYDNALDMNLGGKRAAALAERFGGWNWPHVCKSAGERAVQAVREAPEVAEAVAAAVAAAVAHFDAAADRLRARGAWAGPGGGATDVPAALREQAALRDLVTRALAAPAVQIDSFGAYVFSQDPICPR